MQSNSAFQIEPGQNSPKIAELLKNPSSFLDGRFGNRATLFRVQLF